MKNRCIIFSAITFLFIGLTSFDLPTGWTVGGNKPSDYEVGIAKGEGRNGSNCATIKAVKAKARGFGSLHQGIIGRMYNGKKIKLTVYMKTEGTSVRKWAGFWLNVVAGKSVMHTADIKEDSKSGSTGLWSSDWKKYEIIADVPADTYWINYGGQSAGPGQLWFDDVQIEVVGDIQPENIREVHPGPDNLDFDN
jgi:hypothetical protein